jgi:deoxyribodipyrimidine photo-lyase
MCRYVPELAGVDGGEVHEPWLLRGYTGLDYPARIVDLEVAAGRFRQVFHST